MPWLHERRHIRECLTEEKSGIYIMRWYIKEALVQSERKVVKAF